jgi:hypothetical protein
MEIKPEEVVFDQASLYYGKDIDLTNIDTVLDNLDKYMLGLSDGGVKFKETRKVRDIPFAGSLDRPIKNFQRVLSAGGEVEGEVLIVNKELLEMSLYEKGTTTSTKYDKYISKTGIIPESAYGTLLMVAKKGSEQFIIVLKNCYNENGMSIDSKDKEEAVVKVKFTACISSPTDTSAPVEIYIPKPTVVTP